MTCWRWRYTQRKKRRLWSARGKRGKKTTTIYVYKVIVALEWEFKEGNKQRRRLCRCCCCRRKWALLFSQHHSKLCECVRCTHIAKQRLFYPTTKANNKQDKWMKLTNHIESVKYSHHSQCDFFLSDLFFLRFFLAQFISENAVPIIFSQPLLFFRYASFSLLPSVSRLSVRLCLF